mgnify:CR=1 FL=1
MEIINEVYEINAVINNKSSGNRPSFLSKEKMKGVGRFHTSVEGYKVTPLISLESLAERLSVSKIISGESGAVGLGLLTLLLEREELKELKDRLKLNKNSVVICFSTEGDTDPEQYEATIETF